MTGTRRTHGWDITLYRDEEDNASVESIDLGFDQDLRTALANARATATERKVVDPRWALWAATVDEGEQVERLTSDGIWLRDEFEWNGHRWSLGPDWQEEERS